MLQITMNSSTPTYIKLFAAISIISLSQIGVVLVVKKFVGQPDDESNKKRIIAILGKEYIFIRKLGEGGFGKVYLATERSTGREYAVKIIQTNKFPQYAKRELENMKLLDHRNIVKLYDAIEMWGSRIGDTCYLFMEYTSGGDLHEYIKKEQFNEAKAKEIFRQIISGVQYLHSKGIAHRDLKPQNILLDSNGIVKIADFGLSKAFVQSAQMYTPAGTPRYFAPEILNKAGYNGCKADMYSLGIILHDLVTRYGKQRLSTECRILYDKLTNKFASSRPLPLDVLKDKWLTS